MKNHYALILLAGLGAHDALAQYCEPTFVNGCVLWNNQTIQIGDIDWSLGATDCSISDYTSLSTDVIAGIATPMTVTSGNWTGCAVWVDLDDNGSFEDSENLYYIYVGGDPGYTYDFDITIPAGTPEGAYRMRVIAPWGSDGFLDTNVNGFGPCGAYQYGNFDDFTLNVIEQVGVADTQTDHLPISIGPNPAKDFVTITTDGSTVLQRVTLFAADGRQVIDLPITAPGQRSVVDLSGIPAGAYELRCWDGAKVRTVRLIKE